MKHNQYVTAHKWSSCPPPDLIRGSTRVSTRCDYFNVLNSHGNFQFPLCWRHVDTRVKPGHDVDLVPYLTTPEPRMSLGHLLLDHNEWPALVDAARNGVSRNVETRANAFAAYLLLPKNIAYRWWERDGSPLDWPKLEITLNRLNEHFGLPRYVTARMVERGAPPERRKLLAPIFSAHITNY